jgi:hypothetical protein
MASKTIPLSIFNPKDPPTVSTATIFPSLAFHLNWISAGFFPSYQSQCFPNRCSGRLGGWYLFIFGQRRIKPKWPARSNELQGCGRGALSCVMGEASRNQKVLESRDNSAHFISDHRFLSLELILKFSTKIHFDSLNDQYG